MLPQLKGKHTSNSQAKSQETLKRQPAKSTSKRPHSKKRSRKKSTKTRTQKCVRGTSWSAWPPAGVIREGTPESAEIFRAPASPKSSPPRLMLSLQQVQLVPAGDAARTEPQVMEEVGSGPWAEMLSPGSCSPAHLKAKETQGIVSSSVTSRSPQNG